MSEPVVVTDEQICQFLKFMVELVPQLYVDEKGYPHRKETGEFIYVGAGNKDPKVMKPILLYGASFSEPDVTILNPFVEGMTRNAEAEWFYSVIELAASNYVRMIQKSLIMHAIDSRSKKKAPNNDMELAAILAPWVDKVDETSLKELDQLTKKMTDYFNVFYLPKKREARIHSGVLSDDKNFRIANKKVRAKTWEMLTILTKQMFDTEDFSEYAIISKVQGCPQLDAVLRLLLKIYTMLNRYMKYLPDEVKEEFNHEEVDLDYLSQCIDQLDLFRAKAKYLIPSAMNSNTINTKTAQNPVAAIQPTIGLPGTGNGGMLGTVGLPGQTNMTLFSPQQPQFSVGMTMSLPTANIGIPGMGNGFPMTNVGTPGMNSMNTNAYINTGPFGK